MFVATNIILKRRVLSRQKMILVTALADDTNIILSRQKFLATKDVFYKTFVATKIILVTTPANDSIEAGTPALSEERRVRSVEKILGFAENP